MLTPQRVRQAFGADHLARADRQHGQHHPIPRRQGPGIPMDRKGTEKGNARWVHRCSLQRTSKSVKRADTGLIPVLDAACQPCGVTPM